MNKILVDNITAAYNDKKSLYEEFCLTMQNLLIQLLDNHGYKYQIAHRIKSLGSLTNKIQTKWKERTEYKKLEDIHDLAGIRIVFYLESDKKRFVSDLYKEFTPQNLKLAERHKEKGYRATHVLASFGRKRLILGEYKKFKNMKCEIQLTSALYHAWSEIEHDIFYKGNFSHMKQNSDITELKKDLENTMTKYIEKASSSFEKVAERIKELSKIENA